jgi:hypothetical protein
VNAADLVRAGDARALLAGHGPIEAVVFGGSAGSIAVLLQLLPALPPDLRVPVLGVLLSGASADGAAGLAAIAAAGGMAWVQDPNTAESSLMPNAALRAVPAARALSVAAIRDGLALLSRSAPALQASRPEAP